MKPARLLCIAAGLVGLLAPALGEDSSPRTYGTSQESLQRVSLLAQEVRPKTYGTDRPIVETILASEFAPPASNVGWSFDGSGGSPSIYQTTADEAGWWAALKLPEGALVDTVELQACDFTATGEVLFGLRRAYGDAGANVTPVGGTGMVAASGCGYVPISPLSPLTIDNTNYNYWLFLAWEGDFSSANRVAAVRVYYRLQVSPAPATATFNDVPAGHPFFQFVEALAKSGITAGCGGANYCPDAPLTRGQMAVFLAKALGLQWP